MCVSDERNTGERQFAISQSAVICHITHRTSKAMLSNYHALVQ
jgi:hypothetical protein